MNMPGFTAEFALHRNGRSRGMLGLSRAEPVTAVPGVRAALINTGGGTGGTSWACADDGTCYCLGGDLSDDCWVLSQYCIDQYDCSPNPPYKCTCHWYRTSQPTFPFFPRPVIPRPTGGGVIR